VLVLAVCAQFAALQAAELPLVRANSPRVDVQDGNRLLPGYWTLSPETPLDTYYARRARGDRQIEFRTDIDSISVRLPPGASFDFEFLLNGRRCCHTRISSLRELPHAQGQTPGTTVIPFTFGDNDKIHIQGRVNGSEPLDLEFDLGADSMALFPSALAKHAAPHVDGGGDNSGTGGVVFRSISNDNRLTLGALHWDHEAAILFEKQADRADGIVGHAQFDNQVVEIDYDSSVIRIGGEVPARAATWEKLPITFPHQLPVVPVSIDDGHTLFEIPMVLDTGSNLSLFLNRDAAATHRLQDALARLGTSEMRGTGSGSVRNVVVQLPGVRLGDDALRDLPAHVQRADDNADVGSHLGTDVLKRFNTVLDLRESTAYFTPSKLAAMPYRTNFHTGLAWKVASLAAALSAAGSLLALRRRTRRARAAVNIAT
jgi:hypothetical protein